MRYAIGLGVVAMLVVGLIATANPADNLAGSCCYPDGDCFEDFESGCLQTGGTWTEGAACSDIAGDCPSLAPPCPWDCDGIQDGVIGVTDLLAVLAQWTLVGGSCDFDGGGVGVVDLLKILAQWGPCP